MGSGPCLQQLPHQHPAGARMGNPQNHPVQSPIWLNLNPVLSPTEAEQHCAVCARGTVPASLAGPGKGCNVFSAPCCPRSRQELPLHLVSPLSCCRWVTQLLGGVLPALLKQNPELMYSTCSTWVRSQLLISTTSCLEFASHVFPARICLLSQNNQGRIQWVWLLSGLCCLKLCRRCSLCWSCFLPPLSFALPSQGSFPLGHLLFLHELS